jgi:hypothetical protein
MFQCDRNAGAADRKRFQPRSFSVTSTLLYGEYFARILTFLTIPATNSTAPLWLKPSKGLGYDRPRHHDSARPTKPSAPPAAKRRCDQSVARSPRDVHRPTNPVGTASESCRFKTSPKMLAADPIQDWFSATNGRRLARTRIRNAAKNPHRRVDRFASICAHLRHRRTTTSTLLKD